MTPQQLQQTAAYLRDHRPKLGVTFSPTEQLFEQTIGLLAVALEHTAETEPDTRFTVDPQPQEESRRSLALEHATKAGLGFGDDGTLVRSADTLVAFLRDGTTPPAPDPEQAKTGADLPNRPGAPAPLHEAIDRVWWSIREGDFGALVSTRDEGILEQFRQLGTSELHRATFALGLGKGYAQGILAAQDGAAEDDGDADRER